MMYDKRHSKKCATFVKVIFCRLQNNNMAIASIFSFRFGGNKLTNEPLGLGSLNLVWR
jgi:hypothetical protein